MKQLKLLRIKLKKIILILNEKCINISIIQISFMCILKISATRIIKFSVKSIIKITVCIIGMKNVLNCQITSIKKVGGKTFKIFFTFQ